MEITNQNQTVSTGRIWRYKGCRCCSHPLTGQDCSFCGFPMAGSLNDAMLTDEMRRVRQFRSGLIRGMTDFSVDVFRFNWNAAGSSFDEKGTSSIKIADGADCYGKTVWSEERFAQSPEEKIPPLTLHMHFRNGQTVVPFSVPIQPVRCDDFWRIGIRLNNDMSLSVFLGLESNHAQSAPVMILDEMRKA